MKLKLQPIVPVKVKSEPLTKKKVYKSLIEPVRKKEYKFTIESFYNSVDAIITVIEINTNREVERRYCKVKGLTDVVNKVKKNYKFVNVVEPLKVLRELNSPKTEYVKTNKTVRDYDGDVIKDYNKFQEHFQRLIDCLDENQMRGEISYNNVGDNKYVITMVASSNMARGVHKFIFKLNDNNFKYLYGKSDGELKKICETDSVDKLFNDEK